MIDIIERIIDILAMIEGGNKERPDLVLNLITDELEQLLEELQDVSHSS